MDLVDLTGVVINRAVGQLAELSGEGSRIGSGDFLFRQLQNKLLFHLVVGFLLMRVQIDLVSGGDELRHLQVVGGFHGNRDIRDLPVDGFLRTG